MSELKVLQIETTNLCNSHCVFCVHDRIKEYENMSDELFKKILNDAKKIETIKRIIPMMTGEPLMDKKFINRLKLINGILPNKQIEVYSNGSFLTSKIIKELASIENLTMFFSINGTSKKTRKKLMGLDDYDYVVKMVNLYALTEKPFRTIFVAHPSVKKEEFHNFIRSWSNKALIIPYANFIGEKYRSDTIEKTCVRAISHMTVMWNGKVNLCCFDALGKVIFGDLNTQSIKEVWNSKKRQSYAKAHLNGEIIEPCNICVYI